MVFVRDSNMSNPARDLLNYVDEHKEEMKDDTYKGIVDKLVPINKEFEKTSRSKYKVFYLISDIHPSTKNEAVIRQKTQTVEVYLSETEAKKINNRMDEYGCIRYLHNHDIEDYEGLHTMQNIRSLLFNAWGTCDIEIAYDDPDDEDETLYQKGSFGYENNVIITRIKKV